MSGGEVERLSRLRDGVHMVASESGDVALVAWPRAEKLGRLTSSQRAVLPELSADRSIERLTELCPLDQVTDLTARLRGGGWLVDTVMCDGRVWFTVEPLRPRGTAKPAEPPRLSRFAAIRRDGSEILVESSVAASLIRLHDHRLVETVLTAGSARDGLPPEAAEILVAELANGGFLATEAETGELSGAQWSPHELAFHHGSRRRPDHRMGADFGGTYWARGLFDAPPGRHPGWTSDSVVLPRPDLAQLRRNDPSLARVMEDRHTCRSYADSDPLTVEELGEFLYRTARVRSVGTDHGLEITNRPYPAGGAAYELELYPLVHRVRGLDPALYHYDPYDHRLHRVPATPTARHWLMTSVIEGMTGNATPDVLLVIATRFGRLAWKYQAIGYALTLKHVGVLQQSMYLAATAMRLAPCALGVGDPQAFAAATGLDPLVETSVGEFALGRPVAAVRSTE